MKIRYRIPFLLGWGGFTTLNLEVAEKGVNIDKEVYSQNLTFLLGRYSGLKETLKHIEDILNSKEKEK